MRKRKEHNKKYLVLCIIWWIIIIFAMNAKSKAFRKSLSIWNERNKNRSCHWPVTEASGKKHSWVVELFFSWVISPWARKDFLDVLVCIECMFFFDRQLTCDVFFSFLFLLLFSMGKRDKGEVSEDLLSVWTLVFILIYSLFAFFNAIFVPHKISLIGYACRWIKRITWSTWTLKWNRSIVNQKKTRRRIFACRHQFNGSSTSNNKGNQHA